MSEGKPVDVSQVTNQLEKIDELIGDLLTMEEALIDRLLQVLVPPVDPVNKMPQQPPPSALVPLERRLEICAEKVSIHHRQMKAILARIEL